MASMPLHGHCAACQHGFYGIDVADKSGLGLLPPA